MPSTRLTVMTVAFMTVAFMAEALWCCGFAQELRAEEDVSPDVRKRIERLEQELEALKRSVGQTGEKAPLPAGQDVVFLMEDATLVPMEMGDPATGRMFVMKLAAANLSSQAREIDRQDLSLQLDGKAYALADIPEDRKNTAFWWGIEYNYLHRVAPFQRLRLSAGSSSSGWVYVPDLPAGTSCDSLELVWKDGKEIRKVDLLESIRNRMDLTVERIGPRQCLGFATIGGELNVLGAGILVKELERLAANGVSRVVIAWEPSASQVDANVGNWLRTSAELQDRSHSDHQNLPMIPASIQEIHLAGLPGVDFQPYNRLAEHPGVKRKIHSDAMEGVLGALQEILERAPREELLRMIQSGVPLDRAAALACGSGRLLSEDLPLVLQGADSGDVMIQGGALRGLQHFGEAEAVEKLLYWLRKGTEPLSSIAAVSLASSRFPLGQEKLLEQFKLESVESQGKLLEHLIRHPRPLLSEPLYQFVSTHPELTTAEHLRGLETVGHPELVALLRRGLKSEKPEVQNECLRILIARNSAECDEIAASWTLEQIKTDPPTETMLTVLKRVKNPEGAEPLLRHLQAAGDSPAIVTTLGLIAEPTISPRLIELYPTLKPGVQAEVLTILRNWEIPEFRDLAREALKSEDQSKVLNAAQGLIEGGGDEELGWIGEALEQTLNHDIIQILTKIVADSGNEKSRELLKRIRGMNSEIHRIEAVNGLAMIRRRSPGYSLYEQGMALIAEDPQNQNLKQGIEYFTKALEQDPELFEAYQARGNCHIRAGDLKKAGPDFQKGLEIEPFNADALTGYCVFLAAEGEWEDALKRLEEGDRMFRDEINYEYNSACVLARVTAHLQGHPEIPDRDALLEKYKSEALKRLRNSVENGFEDLEHMKRDPDLESLRGTEEFQKILNQPPSNEPVPKA